MKCLLHRYAGCLVGRYQGSWTTAEFRVASENGTPVRRD